MDGLELCRRIRSHPNGDRSIVLMFTRRDRPEDLAEVLKAGANDYLAKTADVAMLKVRLLIAEQQVKLLQERKAAEEEIRAANQRLTSLIDSLQAGVLFQSENKAILHLNRKLLYMLGLPTEWHSRRHEMPLEVMDTLCYLFDDVEGMVRRMDEISEQRETVKNEELLLADGRILEMDYVPVFYKDRFQGHFWLFRDVTDRIAAEKALKRAREQEVEIGARIQQTLLLGHPPESMDGLSVAALTRPSLRIDGDFHDFYRHNERVLDVVIGDVMGKGIPAALVGAATKSALQRAVSALMTRSSQSKLPQPESIVEWSHGDLSKKLIELGSFVTLSYARLDLRQRVMSLVDCGHTRTIHCGHKSDALVFLKGDNMPLGFSPEERYHQVEIPFKPGDVFFFYSDGITEARNISGELFGEARLGEIVRCSRDDSVARLLEKVNNALTGWIGRDSFPDDLTCVAVKIAE